VSKENLGTWAALIAAAALLVDYMMTVVVSIVAGVFAIGSAFPAANDHKVFLSIGFVWLVTIANLRGARESGTVFAIPTYGFVAAILATIAIGMYQCVGGCRRRPRRADRERGDGGHRDRSLRGPQGLLLGRDRAHGRRGDLQRRAGVPAPRRRRTRRRRWRSWASSPITMFLGISWLAVHVPGTGGERRPLHPRADRVRGVRRWPRLLRRAVLHGGDPDPGREHGLPGLPEALVDPGARPIHAAAVREPRRPLVFSNGIVVLAIVSSIMIFAFDADLTRLIQLYVIGVFMSFTLSQSGMVVHWSRERRAGTTPARIWRRAIVINVIGATATGLVLIVVTVSKFTAGGWLSMLFMAILVASFLTIHSTTWW
jgi:hypothetical protein